MRKQGDGSLSPNCLHTYFLCMEKLVIHPTILLYYDNKKQTRLMTGNGYRKSRRFFVELLQKICVDFFVYKKVKICYTKSVMEKNTRFFVSRKNVLTWLMALCMVCSAVARIVFVGMKGPDDTLQVWSQIVLPIVAALLYAIIVFGTGKELFYKSAIPVWMIAIYYAFLFAGYDFGKYDMMISSLYAIAMVFVGVLYTQITCGKVPMTWLLIPVLAFPLAAQLYLLRGHLRETDVFLSVLPDILMIDGCILTVFAIRIHPIGEYHPTWGDRTDGRRIRTEPPMNQVSPYIMTTRVTSMNLFSESFEITNVERYIRQKRREGLTSFGLMHVLLSAYCRALCKYPGVNRFISGQKIYTHGNDVQFCLTVKKEMSSKSPETVIKVHLTPSDTAEDVYCKINAAVENVKNTPLDSGFDNLAYALMLIPGFFLRLTVWLLKALDYYGMLPKFILELSPFHGSVFFTSMGSLGIPPIYHHLYDFGNLPVFGSFGCKRRALEIQEDGSVVQRKYIDFNVTMDERTVDGFYYASFFKTFKRILMHPEVLDNPPEEIVADID